LADFVALVFFAVDFFVHELLEIVELDLAVLPKIVRAVLEQNDEAKRRGEEQNEPEKFSEDGHLQDFMSVPRPVNSGWWYSLKKRVSFRPKRSEVEETK